MVIITPNQINGLAKLIDNFKYINSTSLSNSRSVDQVKLYLPKFKIESIIDLNEPLQKVCGYNFPISFSYFLIV